VDEFCNTSEFSYMFETSLRQISILAKEEKIQKESMENFQSRNASEPICGTFKKMLGK
jgi:hypothetical protein